MFFHPNNLLLDCGQQNKWGHFRRSDLLLHGLIGNNKSIFNTQIFISEVSSQKITRGLVKRAFQNLIK